MMILTSVGPKGTKSLCEAATSTAIGDCEVDVQGPRQTWR